MRNRRLIVGLVAALAAVGIVGAFAAFRGGADDRGTLNGVSDTTMPGSAPAAADSGLAGAAAARTPDSGSGSQSSPTATSVTAPADGADAAGTAASYLPVAGLDASQTYRATVEVLGRRDGRLAEARVVSARLLGPIDGATGEETGEPADPKADRSGYIKGRTLLATVADGAVLELPVSGPAEVHLVLVPSGEGAVFWIDKVVE